MERRESWSSRWAVCDHYTCGWKYSVCFRPRPSPSRLDEHESGSTHTREHSWERVRSALHHDRARRKLASQHARSDAAALAPALAAPARLALREGLRALTSEEYRVSSAVRSSSWRLCVVECISYFSSHTLLYSMTCRFTDPSDFTTLKVFALNVKAYVTVVEFPTRRESTDSLLTVVLFGWCPTVYIPTPRSGRFALVWCSGLGCRTVLQSRVGRCRWTSRPTRHHTLAGGTGRAIRMGHTTTTTLLHKPASACCESRERSGTWLSSLNLSTRSLLELVEGWRSSQRPRPALEGPSSLPAARSSCTPSRIVV